MIPLSHMVLPALLISKETWNRLADKALHNFLSNEIKIYPNPGPGRLHVSITNPTTKTVVIQLFNAGGQLLYRKEIEMPGRDEIIDIPTSMPTGIYWLRVKGDDFDIVKKILN